MIKVYTYEEAVSLGEISVWLNKLTSESGDHKGDRLDTITSVQVVPVFFELVRGHIGGNFQAEKFSCIVIGELFDDIHEEPEIDEEAAAHKARIKTQFLKAGGTLEEFNNRKLGPCLDSGGDLPF